MRKFRFYWLNGTATEIEEIVSQRWNKELIAEKN